MSNNIYDEGDLYKKRYVFRFIDVDPKPEIILKTSKDLQKDPSGGGRLLTSDPKAKSHSNSDPKAKSHSNSGSSDREVRTSKKSKEILKKDEDLTCAICIDNIGAPRDKNLKLKCGHIFHKECLKGLVKRECPLCRRVIKKLPRDISESIEGNIERYRIERQEEIANEDLLSIIADENLMTTMLLLYSFVRNMG